MATLRAAAGQVDLETPVGSWMSGFAARIEPSSGMHDPIMARAVLLDDRNAALAIVSCDLVGFTTDAVARMRGRIEAATGGAIRAAQVLIACTHTHSGPASMPFRGVMGHVDGPWLQAATRKIVDLVAGLVPNLAPARVASASTVVAGVGHNRQDASRPIDDRLGVIAVDADDGPAIATLLNYATHAVVLGPDNLLISADYPGEVARCVSESRGGIGLFLQGACGDADPAVYRDRGWGTGTFDDAREIGERLAEAAGAGLRGAGSPARRSPFRSIPCLPQNSWTPWPPASRRIAARRGPDRRGGPTS
jgi:neutral ceramidase